jgi:fermentation-respiration switch protein FrsA (DUF1100 family)
LLAKRLVLLAFFALSGCAQLFFYPEEDYVLTPQELRVRYQDIYTDARDGTRLHGWLLHAHGKSLARVLFLHGNAQNIGTHIASVYWLTKEGFDVFLLDYRGYGASQGRPSLEGIHADAEAALQYLVEEMNTDAEGLIVFGQSLGGAVAIHTVARSPYRDKIRALIVEGAFASYPQIAQEKLAELWLTWPLQWIPHATVSDTYDAVTSVPYVSPIPLVIVHGTTDAIVPPTHAYQLYQAAQQPKQLWIVPGADHIEAFSKGAWRARLVSYLCQVSENPFGKSAH